MEPEIVTPTPVQDVETPKPAVELVHKVEMLKMLSLNNRLLQDGCFKVEAHEPIVRVNNFFKVLHEHVLGEALAHADCHLIPELEALKPKADSNG